MPAMMRLQDVIDVAGLKKIQFFDFYCNEVSISCNSYAKSRKFDFFIIFLYLCQVLFDVATSERAIFPRYHRIRLEPKSF